MVAITAQLTTATGVNDIYISHDNKYALVATTSGLDVINLHTGQNTASGTVSSEPLSVTADWQTAGGKVYLGTLASGIFSLPVAEITGIDSDFTGSFVQLFTTATTPAVSDNKINDLDALPGRLLIGTAAGVDFISNETESSTRTLVSGAKTVHLTTAGGYWTTCSGVEDGAVEANYDLITTTGTGIITVDFAYSTESTPTLPAEPALDLAISEVSGNPNLLGFATASGAFVVEESQGSEASSSTKLLTSEAVNSVDFSPDAELNSGCLYATTTEILRVFELVGNTVSGSHGLLTGTRGQTLVTGTVSLVRTTDVGVCP